MQPIALTPWLEHLERHLAVAREGRDPEGVHQVRVAAGRLDVWLDLGGFRVLRDDLAWLRGGASHLRELDVLAASHPPEPWSAWIEARRASRRVEFEALCRDPRLRGLLAALPLLPPLAPARASERLEKLLHRARKRGERIEEDPADIEGFHCLRKSLRRVRFAKEWLGEDAAPFKSLQATLGELNDASVAFELFNEWPEHDALPDQRRVLLERVDESRRRSMKRWKQSRLRAEATD